MRPQPRQPLPFFAGLTSPMSQPSPTPLGDGGSTFADRIKLLIQRVGSATEIARRCGFSEGVVRSWRDGHTDPSRARCVKLARTLGISLVWLVAGEGAITPDWEPGGGNERFTSEATQRLKLRLENGQETPATGLDVDRPRLDAAIRILQSELELADTSLPAAANSDLLAQLYAALGPRGVRVDTVAMLAFNRQLAERIQRARGSA